jgi:hypothetical protein
LIFAGILFLAIQAEADHCGDENDFRLTQRYQTTITDDSPAVWKDRGIRISALPVFVRGATTTAGAVTGFRVSIDYEPDGGKPEVWLPRAFIGNHAGDERKLGPFVNEAGTGFIVEIHVHSTRNEARLEFRLASDGIVIKDKVAEKPPGFSLHYARKPIPEIQLAKRVYAYYSSVTVIVDLMKLASGAVAPEAFMAALVIGEIVDQMVALIPENYGGLVGYTCNRCSRRGKLNDFSGCIDLDCPHCDNEARICFRSISLDLKSE